MKELVFLLEERSAAALLDRLLPRILDPSIHVRMITFEGKQDLEKQVVRRIRGYLNPCARFLVLRDLDSHPNCKILKERLLGLCRDSGRLSHCIVRLACRELETFYLADLAAVEKAFGLKGLSAKQQGRKFRRPDELGSPSKELKLLTDGLYEKISGSRSIGEFLDVSNDRSLSFSALINGVKKLERELLNS